MKPLLAATCVTIAILLLSKLDRGKTHSIPKALWIPLTWLVIGSSRPVSEWFSSNVQQGANYEEGTPLDRTILIILIALALYVLSGRMKRVSTILKANLPIVLFMLYCLASVIWSDFPFVSLKRWIRGVGDILMILVIITDKRWQAAITWVFTRIAFFLIPVSFLLIKFFPEYGRSYRISGSQMWTGVSADKNGLGAICMLFGTALLWQLLPTDPERKSQLVHRQVIAKSIVFLITLYLIFTIDSKTALMCFMLANLVIVLTWIGPMFRKPSVLTAFVVTSVAACYAVLFLGVGSSALQTMGRESNLTGRTAIWATVLPLATNPILGAGYEDFWMGPRMEAVARNLTTLNQAHNGYLEIYLNLGVVGLLLLAIIIFTGYRRLLNGLRDNFEVGRLRIAFFTICLVYNFTEATFKMMSPVWITFLWAVMAQPAFNSRQTEEAVAYPALQPEHATTSP
jgi:exopolysaccharide production protein ExoQ